MKNVKHTSAWHRFPALLQYELKGSVLPAFGFSIWLIFILLIAAIARGESPMELLALSSHSFLLLLYPIVMTIGIFGVFDSKGASLPGGGLDFVFTRAISRTACFRAKSTLYFLCMAIPLLIHLGWSLSRSDLQLLHYHNSPSGAMQERYLQAFPDSYEKKIGLSESRIFIPHGHALLAAAQLWSVLFISSIVQLLLICLAFHQRKSITYLILFAFPLALLVLRILFLITDPADPANTWMREGFIFFCSHWILMFCGLAAFWWLAGRYCERRVEQLEVL